MRPYSPDDPEKEQVRLRLMDAQIDLKRWTSYTFTSNFLQPAAHFSFTVADDTLPENVLDALTLGARVRLYVNSAVLTDGHIDSVDIKADRSGGRVYEIAGHDRLGLAIDSSADPTRQFKQGQTLSDAMKALFGDFGWLSDDSFNIDNSANRSIQTGASRGTKGSHGKKTLGRPLKDVVLHQLKPHLKEGLYAFAARICERFGLHIWCSADGEQLIVGKPDFEQEPLFQLRRDSKGDGNILTGGAHRSMANQPTVIIADGFSGGGEFGKGRVKAYCVNPYFGVDEDGFQLDSVTEFLKKYPDAHQVVMTTQPFRRRSVNLPLRPCFFHDDESKTAEQLENFVRREMSLLMRQSLDYTATVEGHGQVVDGEFRAWSTDTVVDVQDEVTGVKERLWVLGRTFHKSRSGGTKTDLSLVRLHSLQF